MDVVVHFVIATILIRVPIMEKSVLSRMIGLSNMTHENRLHHMFIHFSVHWSTGIWINNLVTLIIMNRMLTSDTSKVVDSIDDVIVGRIDREFVQGFACRCKRFTEIRLVLQFQSNP